MTIPLHFRLALALIVALTAATEACATDLASGPGEASPRPNLVLILADDLGWADAGCYGNQFNETPCIDRLAAEGLRFTQFYAGPVCSPTRANLQSGLDQARFGITQHIPGHRRPYAKLLDPVVPLQLPLEVETYAERLAAAGYATGYFGKWHLGGKGFGPQDQGWQTALETRGNIAEPALTGQDSPTRMTDFLAGKAEEFIDANRNRPFVLQVSHAAVHIPLTTTPELLAKYRNKTATPGYPSLPEYAGLMEELDASVGRVVAAIDRAGIADRTLILFVSDNGGLEHQQGGQRVTSNQPLRGEKGTLYEGGTRVPAIARWTGRIAPGSICHIPATTMDLHPTFLQLAGVELPPEDRIDGVSIVPLFDQPAQPLSRDTLYWHLPHYHHSTPASSIRKGDWKLIEFFETNDRQLFNLADDPGESRNVAGDQPGVADELQSRLAAWREQVGARMPLPNPDYDPARAEQLGGRPNARRR